LSIITKLTINFFNR